MLLWDPPPSSFLIICKWWKFNNFSDPLPPNSDIFTKSAVFFLMSSLSLWCQFGNYCLFLAISIAKILPRNVTKINVQSSWVDMTTYLGGAKWFFIVIKSLLMLELDNFPEHYLHYCVFSVTNYSFLNIEDLKKCNKLIFTAVSDTKKYKRKDLSNSINIQP